jgi:glycosyltransferase involved in cell wall biosynthesis
MRMQPRDDHGVCCDGRSGNGCDLPAMKESANPVCGGNGPAVSVIVPAYNVANCLHRALGSIFAQTLPPHEVIVVDDGSTDETARVAQGYGDHIAYIRQENAGQGAARNKGIALASGKYITFLDADDYWLPEFLKTTTAFLSTHSEAAAVNTGYIVKRRGKQHVGPAGLLAMRGSDGEGYLLDNFFDTWAKYDHVRTGTVLMRRSVIDQAGPQLGIRISQDLEYWGYIATFGPWGFIPKPLWIGDSHAQGMRVGWLQKYRKRRKACPSVEEWEHRIVPRLREVDLPAFRTVRGRVAANFMYARIVAGDETGALHLLNNYGAEMPVNQFTTWSKRSCLLGRLFWHAFCRAVCLREWLKAAG